MQPRCVVMEVVHDALDHNLRHSCTAGRLATARNKRLLVVLDTLQNIIFDGIETSALSFPSPLHIPAVRF